MSVIMAGSRVNSMVRSQINAMPEYQTSCDMWFTPIIIEPISLRVVLWVDPIIDSIGLCNKTIFTNKTNSHAGNH